MGLQALLRKLTSSGGGDGKLLGAPAIFRSVYGREPDSQEQKFLQQLPVAGSEADVIFLFRSVVNSFDHQTSPTPFTVRFAGDDVEYVSTFGVEVAIDKVDPSVGAPVRLGAYEPHLVDFYRSKLRAGMTFVDVGANIGTYSMLAASLVGAEGRVLSFEPNSENCRLVLLGARKNGFRNIRLFPVALGKEAGHVLFVTHIGSNGGLMSAAEGSLTNPSCVVVPTMCLDDMVCGPVDFIKIDVEGAEGLVVQGAMALIEKCRPVITSEFSLEMLPRISGISGLEYLRWFENLGYRVNLIDRESRSVVPITDIGAFVREYGELTRIEDLALIPE